MKRKNTSPKKGQFGYLKLQKKKEIYKTILFFAISFAVFLLGYLTTGKKENLLTIVAVLGMLPASKSTVNMILYLKTKNFSEEIYHKIVPYTENKTALFELVLTSYEKNFLISSVVIKDSTIIGYTEWADCDVEAAQKHISSIAKKNGYKDVTIKIFKELEPYKNKISQLEVSTERTLMEETLESLLKHISL